MEMNDMFAIRSYVKGEMEGFYSILDLQEN